MKFYFTLLCISIVGAYSHHPHLAEKEKWQGSRLQVFLTKWHFRDKIKAICDLKSYFSPSGLLIWCLPWKCMNRESEGLVAMFMEKNKSTSPKFSRNSTELWTIPFYFSWKCFPKRGKLMTTWRCMQICVHRFWSFWYCKSKIHVLCDFLYEITDYCYPLQTGNDTWKTDNYISNSFTLNKFSLVANTVGIWQQQSSRSRNPLSLVFF